MTEPIQAPQEPTDLAPPTAGRGPVRSVLHEVQQALGATFRDDDGWYWTMGFGDGLAGYEAMRGGVAIWDVYPLVKWDVTGTQARTAIQRVFTADLAGQAVGQVKYGAFVDPDGTLVDDGTVFKHSDEHYWVLTNTSGFGDFWAAHTSGLDYRAVNRTEGMPLISVQGPGSRDLLQSLTRADLGSLGYFRFWPEPITVAGVPTTLMRTGFSGELGFELIPAVRDAVELWTAITDAGAVPVGLDTIEPVRIEAGLIIYGTDYTPGTHTPYDVSLDKVVSLDAEFLGRGALAAVAARPPNRLATLVLEPGELPAVGAQVLQAATIVGVLSSRVDSPEFGPIGLAMLATASAEPGSELTVISGTRSVRASVAALSIKDPHKRRARA
jgi:aminomethyltransferase